MTMSLFPHPTAAIPLSTTGFNYNTKDGPSSHPTAPPAPISLLSLASPPAPVEDVNALDSLLKFGLITVGSNS